MSNNTTVLLINLPSESLRSPEEHCGLAILDAFLNSNDIKCDILDSYALNYTIQETKIKIKKWIQQNYKNRCIIGFSPFITSHRAFIDIGKYINYTFCKVEIIAGGHYATLNKEKLLNSYLWLDAIIVGEGEYSLLEYSLSSKNVPVRGVFDRTHEFVSRERMLDLDTLPFQTRYLTLSQLNGQPFALYTSRGCYGECSFCSISSFYKMNTCYVKQTFRSAKSVANEIKLLVSRYNVKNIKVIDDNFFRNNEDEFLEVLINELDQVDISFRLSARPNDITKERGVLLKKLNVKIVAIGVESTHKESLDLFNKKISMRDSFNAINILKSNGITCLANFIMFTPIIDLENLKNNCKFVSENIDNCIFHRINSHLWIRATDPIVKKLVDMGLCETGEFPYLKCKYKNGIIGLIKGLFDLWCEPTMKSYYENVDILMALGKEENGEMFRNYKYILLKDVEVLVNLISMAESKLLESDGKEYVQNELFKLEAL
jgi:hypothetical protein